MKQLNVIIVHILLISICISIVNLQNTNCKNNVLTYEDKDGTINDIEIEVIRAEMREIKAQTKPIKKSKPIEKIESTEESIMMDVITEDKSEPAPNRIPIKAIVTAYAPYDNKSGMCNDGSPDTTATMTKPKHGVLAADPKRLPYGTKIYIPNYGEGVVEDTGGGLIKDKNNIRIDVFMQTHKEAIEWGRQKITVYIIDN